jgi:hypothetical protein
VNLECFGESVFKGCWHCRLEIASSHDLGVACMVQSVEESDKSRYRNRLTPSRRRRLASDAMRAGAFGWALNKLALGAHT